jgi:hypothetical protein
MKVTFLSIAQREYADTANYYNQDNPGLGYEFAAAVDEAIQHQIRTDEIIVVGILHLHRNTESWKKDYY